jgi:FeS assembly SUF system protein
MPEPIDVPKPATKGLNTIQQGLLEGEVIESLRQVYDPELPVNIYDLGLIYGLDVNEHGDVGITMTLTSPNCPVAETLPKEAEDAVANTPGVNSAKVTLVWDPPFSIDMIPDHVKLELGLF